MKKKLETKLELVPVSNRRLTSIRPSPENDELYRPVNPTDPDFLAFVETIRAEGVKVPLVITRDGWIISGHRRYAAARILGLKTVPCCVEPIRKDADHDRFMQLLCTHNSQRVKTRNELLREQVISKDPEKSYRSLIAYRQKQSVVNSSDSRIVLGEKRSDAKLPKPNTDYSFECSM